MKVDGRVVVMVLDEGRGVVFAVGGGATVTTLGPREYLSRGAKNVVIFLFAFSQSSPLAIWKKMKIEQKLPLTMTDDDMSHRNLKVSCAFVDHCRFWLSDEGF
jgi:hypothetical protein